MATLRRWLFLWLLLILSGSGLGAANAEDRAYAAALKSFQDGVWDRAETEFAQYLEKNPQSPHRAEAVLRQAQAQFNQRKFEQAIALLAARQGEADKLADQYLYWRGEAHFHNTNYAAAADVFGQVASGFPASALRLKASVGEAAAWAKQDEWLRVVELLQNPNGPFRQAAQTNLTNEFFARGLLLLAEAELVQKHFAEAEAALQPLATNKLTPELDWQRKFLICRAQIGAGRTDDALGGSAELLSLAETNARPDWRADGAALRADILEQLGRPGEAMALYKTNLAAGGSAERQRQALAKIAELALAQNQVADAIQAIETSLGRFSNSPAADLALLTLGELHLKELVSPGQAQRTNIAPAITATATNHWPLALTNFDRLISAFSNSVLVGKAQLGRGWCYWISNRIPESVEAFQAAAAQLPLSEDLAVARFKLADAQFALNNFTNALQNYQSALETAADLPRVNAALTPQALHRMLRASLNLTNMVVATNVMEKILLNYPDNPVAESSVLLVGQAFADLHEPAMARAEFARFVELFPDSPLRPEVELAMAQTREQKSEWLLAISEYEAWLVRFATNRLRPQAEFYRALANFHAGNETIALTLFTNFVAQFATTDLAPLAQWWVANHYFNQGDYLSAETNFKLLFQKWGTSGLAYEARMMAGRAAVGRQDYSSAIDYFKMLTGDTNCEPRIWIEAMFAYGGTLMLRNFSETNNPSADLKLAIGVFGTLRDKYPNTGQAALAWGEIGNCYFQLGAQDARSYESASNAYLHVVNAPSAGVAARSQAKVGLALVAERQAEPLSGAAKTALLQLARDNYLDVFYETNLREGETRDLYWIKEAGLGAARVVEAEPFQEWAQAVKFYDRLLQLLPQMKDTLEKRRTRAQAQLKPKEN